MAKNKFSLNFDGFLDLAKQVDELGEGYLKKATQNALIKSKDYINGEIQIAMLRSPYNFKGIGTSTGKALRSTEKIAEMPVEWDGTGAKAFVGANLKEAPESIILALGTPHIQGDQNLKNASRVKGKYRKEMERIQQEEFQKVISEAMHD